MHMSQFELLDQMTEASGGVLTTAAVLGAGISKYILSKYVAAKEYERVSHGVYLAPDAWADV